MDLNEAFRIVFSELVPLEIGNDIQKQQCSKALEKRTLDEVDRAVLMVKQVIDAAHSLVSREEKKAPRATFRLGTKKRLQEGAAQERAISSEKSPASTSSTSEEQPGAFVGEIDRERVTSYRPLHLK